MGNFLLLILALVVIYFVLNMKVGVIYMAIGLIIAALVIILGFISSITGDKTPMSVRTNPITLILRIVLAVGIYFFLCANNLVPDFMNYLPEFAKVIF